MTDHTTPKDLIIVETAEGRALLPEPFVPQFAALERHFFHQLPSHCGVASSVVALQALGLAGAVQDQEAFFTDAVEAIQPRTKVWDEGFTLQQLEDALRTFPGVSADAFQAGSTGARLDDFRSHLRQFRETPDLAIIVNYGHDSLDGKGTGRGHFTPVWEYNEEHDRVLLLEVFAPRTHIWVRSEDMFTAMLAEDPMTAAPRGWLLVRPDKTR